MTRILIFAAFALLSLNGFGQGTIRGKVTSMEGEVIPYATVRIKGENKGGTTDFDGLYTIKSVPAGTYTLIFSASLDGFIDQEVEGVQVISGQVTEINKSLTKDSSVLVVAGVSVVRKGIGPGTGQEEIDIKRQNDPGPTDGMGRKQMQQSGVGNAAEGAQMVPGISVEGGKRIYVRGLGDRYTKTLLNGMEIPGLDPDRNTVQLDIFPSTLVDNITVYKSFVPNWSGDYTGGLVNITTRDFPAKKFTYFSGGIGYNQFATFNKDYIGYKGGSFDFLGFDDGTRGLPFNKFTIIPDATSSNSSQLESLLRTFNPTMAVSQRPTFVDQNYTFSIGNQKNKEDSDFSYGYNFVLNYRNQYRFYGDAQFNEFRRINADENLLFRDRASNGQLGENDVMLTGLFGQSFKFKKKNKISVNLFHVQNGKSSASFLEQENFETNPGILEKQALQYTQRSISNLNISGLHLLDTANRWKFEWKVAPSFARVYDPDIRSTALEREINGSDTTYLLAAAVGAEVRRIYRNLNEFNVPVRMDFTHKFTQWDSLKSELRFGVSDVYKTRSFTTYDLNFTADNMTVFSNDPDWYFEEEQLWSVAADSGIVVKGQNEPANNFDASINIAGAYIMNDLPLSKRFKATYGVRAEHALYKFTGSDVSGTEIFNDSTVLNNFNVLPSVNLVYKIEKEADSVKYKRVTNFRGAYSQTVARPSFREKSKAAIYDPIQGRRYNGNMDLLKKTIQNSDLSLE